MLLDVTGTLIAFISIILIMSIMVTATVQLLQSVLRLRSRNLMKGLAQLIMKAQDTDPASGFGWLMGDAASAKRTAAKLLNHPDIALINQVKNPEKLLHYFFLGPKVSWVEPEDIVEPAKNTLNLSAEKAQAFADDFERAGAKLKDRFQLIVRANTFVIGLLLAFGFQVSTPQLFSDLSAQTSVQQQIAGDTRNLLDKVGEKLEAADATELTRSTQELQSELDGFVEQLGAYQIEFWGDEDFYHHRADPAVAGSTDKLDAKALFGVLLTAMLLSLGAPFWYEQLRNAIRFRDLLSGTAGLGETGETRRAEQLNAADKSSAGKKTRKKKKAKKKQSRKKTQAATP